MNTSRLFHRWLVSGSPFCAVMCLVTIPTQYLQILHSFVTTYPFVGFVMDIGAVFMTSITNGTIVSNRLSPLGLPDG